MVSHGTLEAMSTLARDPVFFGNAAGYYYEQNSRDTVVLSRVLLVCS